MNVFLSAPIWLQMAHLVVAEMFWILLVLASTDLLFFPQGHMSRSSHDCCPYEINQPNEIKLGLWLSWTNSRAEYASKSDLTK